MEKTIIINGENNNNKCSQNLTYKNLLCRTVYCRGQNIFHSNLGHR